MSSCSNRCDAVRFDSTDSLSSQSIMVNRFNVILIESIRCNSVRFNSLTIIAKHHGQSVQRYLDRIDMMQFGSIQLTHYHRKASWSISSMSSWSNRYDAIDLLSSQASCKSIRYQSNLFNWLTILSKHRIQSISQPLHRLFVILLARSMLHSAMHVRSPWQQHDCNDSQIFPRKIRESINKCKKGLLLEILVETVSVTNQFGGDWSHGTKVKFFCSSGTWKWEKS